MYTFPLEKTTPRNKRKLATVAEESQDGSLRNNQPTVLRLNEEYIAQISERLEGRVTKKFSQQFSRTESQFLVALSKLDEFLLNPQVRRQSGIVSGTSRGMSIENQEPTGDRS